MINAFLIFAVVGLAVYTQLMCKARALAHADTAAQGTMSYVATMLLDPWIWTVFAAVGAGAVIWLLVLRRMDLSLAYPAMALVYVFVPLGAWVAFGETPSLARMCGLALILSGVIVVARVG